jgi:AmmeMemoRadiSam system protein B/AmmeMemoRadiSam system protein A
MDSKERIPSIAGKFYPDEPDILQEQVAGLLAVAEPKKAKYVRAIISPHAGYMFSGRVAASAFNQIDADAHYKRVFIIGSSHRESFEKAAVYCEGDFIMPYGREHVDSAFCKMLADRHPSIFSCDSSPHQEEHTIEVQLPFLHQVLKHPYNIVPILIGTSNPSACCTIASVLKHYLTSENLFVISTDFSHYPRYKDACETDVLTKDAILTNDPHALTDRLSANLSKHIPHLATSLCGWSSVLTLLYMTTGNEYMKYYAIDYSNSGDVKYYSDRSRVVGYWAIALSEHKEEKRGFYLSGEDKAMMMQISRNTLEEFCIYERIYEVEPADLPSSLHEHCGAFVSLHKNGRLRGCIGRLTSDIPLYQLIQEMTIAAAMHDSRFPPVKEEELDDIEIEISVLSPLKQIDNIAEIKLGKHGIYIEDGYTSGVFLPQVATETGWNTEQFLGHCARDKAGLDWDGWKNARLYIFTATVFPETIES